MDDLAYLADDDLISLHQTLHIDCMRVFEAHLDAKIWEVELAYVKREMQLRRERRIAHDDYLRSLDRENAAQASQEARLPFADLDNTAFVMAGSN